MSFSLDRNKVEWNFPEMKFVPGKNIPFLLIGRMVQCQTSTGMSSIRKTLWAAGLKDAKSFKYL